MASIAQSLRAARPSALFNIAKIAPVRTAISRRPFSSTPIALEKRFTKEHEWIDVNRQKKTGVIGISEYAAEQLGDVVYVELPAAPATDFVEQGDAIGAVESVKSASDINAPVRCRIVGANSALEEKPAIINQVPEDDSAGGGWLAKVEVDDASLAQLEELMDAEAYAAYTQDQEEH